MAQVAKTIFIMEDDQAIKDVLRLVLEEAGHVVKTPDNVSNLSQLLLQDTPDCILFDIHFQNSNMLPVIKSLQKEEHTSKIPIYIVSADDRIAELAKMTKAEGFLKKPFTIEELLGIVERI